MADQNRDGDAACRRYREPFADLEGKRVATTLTAQAQMREIILMMLSLGGLSEDDVVASSTGNVGQALQQLTEGSIDATLTAVGIPAVQQANATISGGVRYIDLAGENTTAENMDAIVAGTFPAPLTPDSNLAEVQEDITVASWDIYLIGSADMPDEEAGAIATAVYEAWEELKSEVPALGATATRGNRCFRQRRALSSRRDRRVSRSWASGLPRTTHKKRHLSSRRLQQFLETDQ